MRNILISAAVAAAALGGITASAPAEAQGTMAQLRTYTAVVHHLTDDFWTAYNACKAERWPSDLPANSREQWDRYTPAQRELVKSIGAACRAQVPAEYDPPVTETYSYYWCPNEPRVRQEPGPC